MIKKILLFMFCIILLIGNVSAFEIDDWKTYDTNKKEYTITNYFGLGKEISNIKLNTPQDFKVPIGYQKVAEMDFNNGKFDYGNIIKGIELYNIKDGMKTIVRNVDYKYKTLVDVNDYKTSCKEKLYGNGSIEKYDCTENIVGTHKEERWIDFTSNSLLKGENITLGLFTEVEKGDKVEWIINVYGNERLEEWAVWTASLNVDLQFYLAFEGNVSANIIDSTDFSNNGTGTNMEDADFIPGIIGNGLKCDGVDEFMNFSDAPQLDIGPLGSVGYWANFSLFPAGDHTVFRKSNDGSTTGYNQRHDASNFLSFMPAPSTNILVPSIHIWHHYLLTKNSTTLSVYFDGNLTATNTGGTMAATPEDLLLCGPRFGFANVTFDEFAIWNRTLSAAEASDLYNNGTGISFLQQEFDPTITLSVPLDNTTHITPEITFNCSATINPLGNPLGVINVSLFIDNVINTTIFNTTSNQSLSLQTNLSFLNGNHNWTCNAFNENNLEGTTSLRTFTIEDFIENNLTFNTTTFDTATENFILNITTEGETITAEFFYNGTSQGASTITGTSTNPIISNNLQIPIGVSQSESKQFYWTITLDSIDSNTTFNNQTVNRTIFQLCNTTINNPYLEFTFKNETISEENVNATISSSFFYWLGDGTINKTLTFSNATENQNYTFCLNNDRTLNVDYSLDYNNGESQQRTFSATSVLTNVVTKITLFLLPSTEGLFAQFQTVQSLITSIPVTDVKGTITRILGGSTITVTSAFTDSVGRVVYFLDPDITYTGTFVKAGFVTNVFSFVPVTDLTIVAMGGTAVSVNGSQIGKNLTYDITPSNGSLLNNTDITFGFNVTGNTDVTLISMNITNSSGTQLLFQSNAGIGFISGVVNTGNLSQIRGLYIITTGNETLTISRLWVVGVEFVGDYSIFRQATLYLSYGFQDFLRLTFVVVIIIAVLIFMSGAQITDTSESKVVVAVLLMWAFSIVGWLNNPAVVATTGLAEFGRQYGIAIISTAAGSFFVFRRIFL